MHSQSPLTKPSDQRRTEAAHKQKACRDTATSNPAAGVAANTRSSCVGGCNTLQQQLQQQHNSIAPAPAAAATAAAAASFSRCQLQQQQQQQHFLLVLSLVVGVLQAFDCAMLAHNNTATMKQRNECNGAAVYDQLPLKAEDGSDMQT